MEMVVDDINLKKEVPSFENDISELSMKEIFKPLKQEKVLYVEFNINFIGMMHKIERSTIAVTASTPTELSLSGEDMNAFLKEEKTKPLFFTKDLKFSKEKFKSNLYDDFKKKLTDKKSKKKKNEDKVDSFLNQLVTVSAKEEK